MIQDLFPHQFYNEFSLKRDAQDNDEVFVFDGNNVLVSGDGENSPLSLPKASAFNQKELTYLFKIDDKLNLDRGHPFRISTPDSKIDVWVIPTNEELVIARDTLRIISE